MATQQDLRTLVDRFVTDLSVLVHQDALDAVRAALGESPAPVKRGPGRPRKAAKRGPGRPKAAAKRGPGRPKKAAPRRAKARVRRSAADLDQTADEVLAYVRAKPGQGVEEIGRGLKTATEGLKRPIQVLIAAGKLRTQGQKRGTKYFAGEGGKKAARKGPKAGRRKTTKKKATKREAGKSKRKAKTAGGKRRKKAAKVVPAGPEPQAA